MYIFKPKQQSDGLQTCCKILTYFGVKHTVSGVNKLLDQHVESHSMLAIKDVLFEYGLESAAIRKGDYSYEDFEVPFICSIQQEDWSQSAFTLVTGIDDGKIAYLDPITNTVTSIGLTDFEAIDKEVIMLLDSEHKKAEVNYDQNRSKEFSQNLISKIPVYAFIIVLLSTLGFMFLNRDTLYWSSPLFLITSAVGLFISLLLVWHDVDAHNPFIKEVCGGQGRKMNCEAVLSSSGATFLGISWAVWGFAYFATLFLSMILFAQMSSYFYIWAIFSLIAALYIPFSLYYQSQVVKQWCPLCLSVLGVILINAIASIFIVTTQPVELSNVQALLRIVTIGLIFLLSTYYAMPMLKEANESKSYAKRYKKLRYNPEIFQALLDKSAKIHIATDGLGIVVGNPDARNEIVKVCNPYCGPCAKAHPELEQIIRNNGDVKVRIIFTATGEDDDIKTAPVAHLLAIQEKYGKDRAHEALDDWYLAEKKDYESFAKQHPINGELKQQKVKIQAMRDWCNEVKVRVTPTIYVNGAELPDSYRIAELKNFF